MARATVNVAATMMGPAAFGSNSRNMIQPLGRPSIRAAITKSRSRKERTSASTRRAISIQLVTAMMTVIMNGLGLTKAASARSRKMLGKERNASTKRIRIAPTRPP
ncbi:hypothetical protein D3C86_1513440 [compost metagenome]